MLIVYVRVNISYLTGGTVPRMIQSVRAAILRQNVAILHGLVERFDGAVHVARLPCETMNAVYKKLFHLFALGSHDRRAAAHGLQVDLTERFGHRRVDEVVGGRVGRRQLFALQEAHEVRAIGGKERL